MNTDYLSVESTRNNVRKRGGGVEATRGSIDVVDIYLIVVIKHYGHRLIAAVSPVFELEITHVFSLAVLLI